MCQGISIAVIHSQGEADDVDADKHMHCCTAIVAGGLALRLGNVGLVEVRATDRRLSTYRNLLSMC